MSADATFDVGKIEAEMTLDVSPFQAGLNAAKRMARDAKGQIDRSLNFEADANTTKADAKIKKTKAEAASLGAMKPTVDVGIDTTKWMRDLATLKAETLLFAKQVYTAKVAADTRPFWADIASLRSLVSAMTFTPSVDLNVGEALAQLAALRAAFGQSGAVFTAGPGGTHGPGAFLPEPWIGGGGTKWPGSPIYGVPSWPSSGPERPPLALGPGSGGGSDTGGLGSMLGGAAGGAGAGAAGAAGAAAAGGAIAWIHALHLLTPAILGFAAAIGSVAVGFTALGIASFSTVSDVISGYSAVDKAQSAISSAIPGTTQWTAGVLSLGNAWSAIPTALQPAVSALNNFLSNMGGSVLGQEVQGFIVAQVGALTSLLSGAGSVWAPLILATERAVLTVESMIRKALGSGGMIGLVHTLSAMVGPATIELVQMGGAILHIAGGFGKAVADGKGMELLVHLMRTLATVVNSTLFQGFIAGWVLFDQLLTLAIEGVLGLVGVLSGMGANIHGAGIALGFIVSGLLAIKSAAFLLGKAGLDTAAFSGAITGLLGKTAGIGLFVVGLTGLVGEVAKLFHHSNPLATAWHAVGKAFGFAHTAAKPLGDTINGYTVKLKGAIPVTGHLTQAMDLLARSEQSIGSNLLAAATGFKTFTVKATDSVAKMIANLNTQNTSIASWAAEAQLLIKRGMDPTAVASLAQQAPQDLASMATATTAQLGQMNVQWAEKMMEAQMAGQQGVNGMIAAIIGGITKGTPTTKAAAQALATTLGKTLNVPFTGSVASVQAIGKALNQLPASVIATLAGQTHQYAGAMNDAQGATQKAHKANSGWVNGLISTASNLAMVGVGLKLYVGSVIKHSASILKTIAKTLAGWTTYWAKKAAGAAKAGVLWLADGAKRLTSWLLQTGKGIAKTLLAWTTYWATKAASAATAGLAWLADNAKRLASWLLQTAGGITKTLLAWTGYWATKAKDAAVAGLAWLVANGKRLASWLLADGVAIATDAAKWLAMWVARSAQAVVQGAIWLAKNAATLTAYLLANTTTEGEVEAGWAATWTTLEAGATGAAGAMMASLGPLVALAAGLYASYKLLSSGPVQNFFKQHSPVGTKSNPNFLNQTPAQQLSKYGNYKGPGIPTGALGGIGGQIHKYALGGFVPGPIGQAALAIVHGGETVLPADPAAAARMLAKVATPVPSLGTWGSPGNAGRAPMALTISMPVSLQMDGQVFAGAFEGKVKVIAGQVVEQSISRVITLTKQGPTRAPVLA